MSRLALVTGGATGNDGVGGIGAAICTALAGTGHRVAVADIDGAGAKRTASTIAGSGHRGIQLDVRDRAASQRVFAEVEQDRVAHDHRDVGGRATQGAVAEDVRTLTFRKQ